MLEVLETPVIVIHVITCFLLILVVLIQPGKSGGLGAALGGAGAQQVFGGRGAGNFLSKGTWGLAAVFFFTSMFLAYISSSTDDSLAERAAAAMADDGSGQPEATAGTTAPEAEEQGGAGSPQ